MDFLSFILSLMVRTHRPIEKIQFKVISTPIVDIVRTETSTPVVEEFRLEPYIPTIEQTKTVIEQDSYQDVIENISNHGYIEEEKDKSDWIHQDPTQEIPLAFCQAIGCYKPDLKK